MSPEAEAHKLAVRMVTAMVPSKGLRACGAVLMDLGKVGFFGGLQTSHIPLMAHVGASLLLKAREKSY